MPQASSELQNAMFEQFGSHTDDSGPMNYLQDHGWTLTRHWTWKKSTVSKWEDIPIIERLCINFLIEEWDFGGWEE